MIRAFSQGVRLNVGITMAFIMIMVPSMLGVIWFVYERNYETISTLADEGIQRTSEIVVT